MAAAKQRNIVDEILEDHREVDEYFNQIEDNSDPHLRGALVERVITELVRHSVGEEQYVYPAARKMLPNGEELTEHEIEEHAEAEEVMRKLEGTDADDPAFDGLVQQLIKEVRHHIEDEEKDLLPQLAEACDSAELDELGAKFAHAKSIAPTRPHPSAPDRPPVNKILDPGVGLIDRMRDALTGRNS
ncbi:MAG: hemerythrin [Mycobacterium sp.]|nr:hemerythrin [Mycobacterium sp.]